MKKFIEFFIIIAVLSMFATPVDACSRVVYKGVDKTVITARSMDWKSEIDVNLWILPKGVERTGEVGELSVEWRSKYGSVVATAWDIATADGMNEKGLVANVLWLVESEYPKFDPKEGRPAVAISLWAQ